MRLTDLYPVIETTLNASGIVQTVTRGDVYDNWNNESMSYVAANYDIVATAIDANTSRYTIRLFVADRLTEDASNETQALDIAEGVIRRFIVDILAADIVEVTEWETAANLTPFTQKFADNLAGYYTDITIVTLNQISNC